VINATYIPAGTYEYTYSIRPGVEGTYNVIPPTARETYFPEVYGRGAGSVFTVLSEE
jgi:alpha-2-macroglobulin